MHHDAATVRGIVTPNSIRRRRQPMEPMAKMQCRQSSRQNPPPRTGSKTRDLFADLRAAPRRSPRTGQARAPSPARGGARPAIPRAHRGAGRSRAGAPAARHVYRRHRREGAASPVRRGDRQFHGRGAGRPRHLHRRRDGGRRLRHRDRQRPRHPGRPASEVQEQVRARSDHVHAARRRQIRFRSLRDLGRPARRRRVGRQRAVASAWRSRSRASRRSTAWCSSAASRRASWKRSAARPTAAAPRSASGPTRRSSARRRISGRSASSRCRAPRPICSAASRSAGRAPRSSCAASRTCPRRRRFHFADGLKDYLSAQPSTSATLVHPDIFTGSAGKIGKHGAAEWAVAWTADADGFLSSYCNTIPTAGRRHARVRPAQRAARAASRTTPSASARASARPRSPSTT